MVGALVVQGKDKLAKVMRNSPIRYLGPIYQGGRAELTRDSGLILVRFVGGFARMDSTVALPVLALWNLFAIWKVLAISLGNDSVIRRYPA